MDLTKILSISGKPGLHRLIGQTKTGMVVESLTGNHRFTAFSHQRISSLEEISVYSYAEDVPLREVLKKIHDYLDGGQAPDPKDNASGIREFFEAAFPEFDQERVYDSDIKKILSWYNILQSQNLLEFDEVEEEAPAEEGEETSSIEADEISEKEEEPTSQE